VKGFKEGMKTEDAEAAATPVEPPQVVGKTIEGEVSKDPAHKV
jgi:hypothetical protein